MRRNELAEERRERADDSFREHLPLAIHAGTPTTSSPPFLFDPYLGVSASPRAPPLFSPLSTLNFLPALADQMGTLRRTLLPFIAPRRKPSPPTQLAPSPLQPRNAVRGLVGLAVSVAEPRPISKAVRPASTA